MTEYRSLLSRKWNQYGEKFDPSDLDRRFVRYFNSGERIRVRTMGEELTGTVGVTMGWKPCFLLMRTVRSTGSVFTLGPRDEILAVQKGRKYVPIPS